MAVVLRPENFLSRQVSLSHPHFIGLCGGGIHFSYFIRSFASDTVLFLYLVVFTVGSMPLEGFYSF